MKLTETIEGWTCEFDDYDGSFGNGDSRRWILAKYGDYTVSVEDHALEVELETRAGYSGGSITERVYVPLAVIERLLDWQKNGASE